MEEINDRGRRRFLAATGALSAAALWPAHAADSNATPPATLLPLGLIHLNTASLGATSPAVLERVLEAWHELESSPVLQAYRREDTVVARADAVRGRAAALLGCSADEILITRSTTEGMNLVALGLRWRAGDRVLTTDQEHDGGSAGWRHLERRHGIGLDRIAIAPDEHDPAALVQRFADAIGPRTCVISVSHVITSTGLRMPVAALSALARERGLLCVVDGAQAAGGIAVDVKALGCHAYATSGHKWLMGPKGTGLLYVSRDADDRIQPVSWELDRDYGGGSMGVGPMPLALGLGVAIDALLALGMDAVERHDLGLRNRAWRGLRAIEGIDVLSAPPGPLATPLVSCRLPDAIDSRAVQEAMRTRHGILVKMVEKQWFNGIRLSPHLINTASDIDAALAALRTELGRAPA